MLDDALVEGAESVVVTLNSTDNALFTINAAANSDSVSIADDDLAGVTVIESGGNTTATEGGANDTVDYVLTAQPSPGEIVTITVSPDGQSDLGAGAGNPITLFFDDSNWNTAQTVTVIAFDDIAVEGNHTSLLTATTVSNLGAVSPFDALVVNNVTVNIIDNDAPGVSVIQTGGSTDVTEGGATDTLNVVLTSQPLPGETVTVTLTPDGETDLGAGPATPINVNFDSTNWNNPQSVTVTANDDAVIEGNHNSTISTTTTSTQPAFNGLTAPDVIVNITDNDFAGVTIIESGGSTNVTEGGATDTVDYVLDAQPAPGEIVTLTITPDGQTDLGTGPGNPVTMNFDNTDWNIPQTITVTAFDDVVVEGGHSSILSTSSTSNLGAGSPFNAMTISNVTVGITDNDSTGGPGVSTPLGDAEVVPENLLQLDPGFTTGSLVSNYNTISAPGAVIETVRSVSSEQFGDQINGALAGSDGLFDANPVKGFSLRSAIIETNNSGIDSLFPLRIGDTESDADPSLQDELILESLINNRTLYLDIEYLVITDQTLEVVSIKVTLPNGEALPNWLVFNEDERQVVGEPPVDAENIQFRVEVELNNGQQILRYVEIDVQSGVISELEIENTDIALLGTELFSNQLDNVATSYANNADAIIKALNA